MRETDLVDRILSYNPKVDTRIIKKGYRYGDSAPMAIIEFIDRDKQAKTSSDSVDKKAEETVQVDK